METLNKECYAYPDKQLYPVHTKQAALDSYKEFEQDLGKYSQDRIKLIADNFIKAASVHDIKYPVHQEAAPQLVTFDLGDISVSMSKIASAEDMDKAIEAIQSARQKVPLKELKKVALYVLKQAQAQNIDSESIGTLYKYAGLGICDPQQISSEFCKRGQLISMSQSMKSDFYKAYRELREASQTQVYKKTAAVCNFMDGVDRLFDLQRYYGTKLQKPQDVCYKETIDDLIKTASDYLRVPSTSTILSKSALLQNKDKVRKFIQDNYQQDITQDDKLLAKVASLTATGIKALIQEL